MLFSAMTEALVLGLVVFLRHLLKFPRSSREGDKESNDDGHFSCLDPTIIIASEQALLCFDTQVWLGSFALRSPKRPS